METDALTEDEIDNDADTEADIERDALML